MTEKTLSPLAKQLQEEWSLSHIFTRKVDDALKQAQAEVLAASTRLHEAARTVLHIVDGVGKAGGPPQFGEEFAAWKELQASVDKLQPAAQDLEELLRNAELKGRIAQLNMMKGDAAGGMWFPDPGKQTINDRIAELEKARAILGELKR